MPLDGLKSQQRLRKIRIRIKTRDKESTAPGSGTAMVQGESRRWYLCHS